MPLNSPDFRRRHCLDGGWTLQPRAWAGVLAYDKRTGRGWSAGTILYMLRNERYIGTYRYNRREWFIDPETEADRSRQRPEADWFERKLPELAIIERAVWDRVQARAAKRHRLGSPRQHPGHRPSVLRGYCECGVCGNGMQITGRGKNGKEQYRNLGCAGAKKGEVICTNKAQISERKVIAAVAGALGEIVERPAFFEPVFERFRTTFARLLADAAKPQTRPATKELDAAIARQRAEVEKTADVLFQVGVSETLKARLHDAEAKLKALEDQRAAAQRAAAPKAAAVPLPSREQLKALFSEVQEALSGDPARGNLVLKARLAPVVLTPRNGEWSMRTALKMEPAALVTGGRQVRCKMVAGARW